MSYRSLPGISCLSGWTRVGAYAVTAIALASLGAAPAFAALIVTPGVSNTGTDNVLFNDITLANDAFQIEGITNTNPAYIVNFDATETLHADGGQALIQAADGSYTAMTVSIPGKTFTKLVWNLNTLQGAGTGAVTFTINGVAFPDQFPIGNGSNFFTLEATGGMTFSNIGFSTTIPLQDTRQIRIGGIGIGGSRELPEPSTLFMATLGFCAVLLFRRAGWLRSGTGHKAL